GATPVRWKYFTSTSSPVLVVLLPEVRDHVFAHHPAQRVLQLGLLHEEVVLRIQPRCDLRRLEVERQPFLHAAHARSLRQIEEEGEIEDQWGGQDRVAAEEVDLDLHRVATPPEDVDVVPPLLVVP